VRQRVDVRQAAEILGTTPEAVRKRILRGTLEGDKDEDGKVFVWVDDVQDNGRTLNQDPQTLLEAKDETIQILQERIEAQQRELDQRAEELKRKDHLLAAALERIPAIEAPQPDQSADSDARESSVTASEEQSKGAVPPDVAEGEIKQSFWRRLFGG